MKDSDLINNKFNEWTVLAQVNNRKFLCKCSCGIEKEILKRSLISGRSKCCGKKLNHRKEKIINPKKPRNFYGICEGKIIGNFKVLKRKGIDINQNYFLWEVQCLLCNKIRIMKTRDIPRQKSCGCLKTKPKGESGFNQLYTSYKMNAKKRNIEFLLTREEFKTLTKQNCYYCGEEPKQVVSNKECVDHSSYVYNGIDRIDNTKGYTKNNCVSCCGIHNKMKMCMSYHEFIDNIKKIVNYLKLDENKGDML